MEQSFYSCEHCGSVVTFMTNKGVPVMCCGQGMKALIPGTTDASAEKHVPVVSAEGDKVAVAVGSAAHPMAQEHYIEWIMLETKQGVQLKRLKPGGEPRADFMVCRGDEAMAAYAYCNLHSLWKSNKED